MQSVLPLMHKTMLHIIPYYHWHMLQCKTITPCTSPSTTVTGSTQLTVVWGSLILGTGSGGEAIPGGPPGNAPLCAAACGHPTSHPFWGFPRQSSYPHCRVHHAWVCWPIRHHGQVGGLGWHPELPWHG